MPQDSTQHLENLSKLCESKRFLSKEFLTWLWYCIEETGGEMELAQIDDKMESVNLWIDDKIILEDPQTGSHKHSLKGGNPSASLEATAALVTGKTVTELKLGAHIDEKEYTFTLNHKDLSPKSLGLPKVTTASEDPGYQLLHRVECISEVTSMIDALFLLFLSTRTEESWENKEMESIREWIVERGQGEITFH